MRDWLTQRIQTVLASARIVTPATPTPTALQDRCSWRSLSFNMQGSSGIVRSLRAPSRLVDGAVRLQRSSSVKPSDKKPKACTIVQGDEPDLQCLHLVAHRLTGLARFHHREPSPGRLLRIAVTSRDLALSQARCSAAKCQAGQMLYPECAAL